MKKISLIGATGSIGRQVCAVARRYPDKFRIVSMAADRSAEDFLKLVKEFRPEYAALADEKAADKIADGIPEGVRFAGGAAAAREAVAYGDTAMIAATGFAGLGYTLKAAALKKDIALANKETLVCGGELAMKKIKGAGIRLMPVDSEHSALWQALGFRLDAPFRRLIVTASGGPFYSYTAEQLQRVTPEDALRHPTWTMGAKITIDSATLLNKGFEVIEAKWLYGAPLEKIHTVVQPESIIHSMVEFEDGAVLAQMSYPSMELPIQLALTYPERMDCALKPLDFEKLGSIRFLPLERKRFPCYDLALSAAETGDNFPCALNGAGEIAVRAFLEKRIPFPAIAETIENVLSKTERAAADSYEALFETDARARRLARESIAKRA
ncbi:MAG: 1-deoxy-D-xylulose-5-phosphate reductoisomerase [Firmicutes bacterium]|jgi:1-deoxy-D-xylulose 5-phosphate reductoisomerase|nr:1-deoxy-D-xylulose-5-phosphate reductoisomerase [Bacillota bacterium]